MTEEPGPEKDAGTKAGRDLLDRMDRYDGLWHGAVQDIIAIEREAATAALAATSQKDWLAVVYEAIDRLWPLVNGGDRPAMSIPPDEALRGLLVRLEDRASRDSTPDPLE